MPGRARGRRRLRRARGEGGDGGDEGKEREDDAGSLQLYVTRNKEGLYLSSTVWPADGRPSQSSRTPSQATRSLDSTPRELTIEIRPKDTTMLIDGVAYGDPLPTAPLLSTAVTLQFGMAHVTTAAAAALFFDDLQSCIIR